MRQTVCAVLVILMIEPSQATICLRAPQVSASEYREWLSNNPHCQNTTEILFRQMQTDPEVDLEVLGSKLKKANGSRPQQIAIFKDFFERKKKQAWSKRTVETVIEVLKRWDMENSSAEIRSVIDQLDVESSPGSSNPIQNKDWQDVTVFRDGENKIGIEGQGDHHWVIFSSIYRPVIFWGSSSKVQEALRKDKRPWLTGTCQKPLLNFNTSPEQDYLFLYPQNCVASRPALVLPINKSQPTLTTFANPQKSFYEKPLFWAITAVSTIVVSAALKNKTVTVRSAF